MTVKNCVFSGFAVAVLLGAGVTSANAAATSIASKEYVDNSIKGATTDMVTNTTLNQKLGDYVDNSTLETTLNNYVTQDDLDDLELDGYAKTEALDAYQLKLTSSGAGANIKTDGDAGVLHSVTAADGTVTFVRETIKSSDLDNNFTVSADQVTGLGALATEDKVTDSVIDDGSISQGKISGLTDALNGKLTKGAADELYQGKLTESNFTGENGVSVTVGEDGNVKVSGENASTTAAGVVKLGTVADGDQGVVTGDAVADAIATAVETATGADSDLQQAIDGKLDKNTADNTYQAKSQSNVQVGMANGGWATLAGADEHVTVTEEGKISVTGFESTTNKATAINDGNSNNSTMYPTVGAVTAYVTKAVDGVMGGDFSEAMAGKQDALDENQMAAVNSGITAEKVGQYDDYADLISGKVDKQQSVNNGFLTTNASGQVTVTAGGSELAKLAELAKQNCPGDSGLCVLSFDGTSLSWTDVTKDSPDAE